MAKKKEVQKTEPGQLVINLPMESIMPRGMEEASASEIVIPKVVIAQKAHDDIEELEGLSVGQFFNPTTKEVYGTEIELVLLQYKRRRLMFEKGDTAALLCRSEDGKIGTIMQPGSEQVSLMADTMNADYTHSCENMFKTCTCPYGQWGKDEEGEPIKPPCSEILEFLAIHPRVFQNIEAIRSGSRRALRKLISNVLSVQFKRTSYKVGKNLKEACFGLGDLWDQSWVFKAKDAQSGTYKYKTWSFIPGQELEEEEFALCEAVWGILQKMKYTTDDSEAYDSEPESE